LDDRPGTVSVGNITAFKRKLGKWVIRHSMTECSGSNTDYKTSNHLQPLLCYVMLCYVMLCYVMLWHQKHQKRLWCHR